MNNFNNNGLDFESYLEYLASMGKTLDEFGNVVDLDEKDISLTLNISNNMEDDDE